ncbi:hypothetical protein ON010_g16391 [Phytophthora cinnamomi]|nr:hypothetical protein ON010_g16391 [Phytophthora cinnamomi]
MASANRFESELIAGKVASDAIAGDLHLCCGSCTCSHLTHTPWQTRSSRYIAFATVSAVPSVRDDAAASPAAASELRAADAIAVAAFRAMAVHHLALFAGLAPVRGRLPAEGQ